MALGVVALGIVLLALIEPLGFRYWTGRPAAYAPLDDPADFERTRQAILYRIGALLRPRDGAAAIGGDPTARLIEAGLLHGRLALWEERRGNGLAARRHMQDAIALLESAHHHDPSEEYVRAAVTKQMERPDQPSPVP